MVAYLNNFSVYVRNPLGSYTQVFTVPKEYPFGFHINIKIRRNCCLHLIVPLISGQDTRSLCSHYKLTINTHNKLAVIRYVKHNKMTRWGCCNIRRKFTTSVRFS